MAVISSWLNWMIFNKVDHCELSKYSVILKRWIQASWQLVVHSGSTGSLVSYSFLCHWAYIIQLGMIFAWLWLQQLTCLSKGYHTIIADLGFEEFQMEEPKLNFSGFYTQVKFIQFTWNRLKNVEQLLSQQCKHSQFLPSCIDYRIDRFGTILVSCQRCQIFRAPQRL